MRKDTIDYQTKEAHSMIKASLCERDGWSSRLRPEAADFKRVGTVATVSCPPPGGKDT